MCVYTWSQRIVYIAINTKKCYVTGRGVQQNGIRVGDSADFVVHTDGVGDGELAVHVEGPGGVEEPVRLNKVIECWVGRYRGIRGADHGGLGGVLTPWNMYEGSEYVLTPWNVTFFHSKLSLDNSATFTSWRMKDMCQKWKVKLIFRGAWNSLMAWPDWPVFNGTRTVQFAVDFGSTAIPPIPRLYRTL